MVIQYIFMVCRPSCLEIFDPEHGRYQSWFYPFRNTKTSVILDLETNLMRVNSYTCNLISFNSIFWEAPICEAMMPKCDQSIKIIIDQSNILSRFCLQNDLQNVTKHRWKITFGRNVIFAPLQYEINVVAVREPLQKTSKSYKKVSWKQDP